MSRLSDRLAAVKGEGRKILVPFITGDYPDRDTFVALLLEAQEAGAEWRWASPFPIPAPTAP